MINKGEYQTPEPYQNLDYGIQKVQQSYLYYRTQGVPEERLELLRQWMEDADGLVQKARIAAQQSQIVANQQAQIQQAAPAEQPQLPAEPPPAAPVTPEEGGEPVA